MASSSSSVHSVLARVCAEITPELNPDIMRGLATMYLKDTIPYLESIAKRNFHQCVPGLVFLGIEKCTTEEEYRDWTHARGAKRQFDFAESYIYRVKLRLGLQVGEEILEFKPKYLSVPYVLDGGLMKLSGSLFHVKPVLSNKVISPGHKQLFVRMLGTRKNFYRSGYSLKVDGQTQTTFVVHSAIYDAKTSSKKGIGAVTTKANSTMTHYLLLRYGFTETFRKYLGHVPVVGYGDEITPEQYPPEDWVIVSTAHTHVKPAGFVESLYESSHIRLAVRKDKWTQATIALVSELFYVIDHFPDKIKPKDMDNPNAWLMTMGYILVGGQYTVDRIYSQMNEHLTSLDDFVDEFARDKLSEKGYVVDDFYDLAAMLSMYFPDLLAENDRAGNIYEKYYDVLYHVMRPISYALTRTRYAFQQAAKRGMGNNTSPEALFSSLSQVLTRRLNPGAIFSLNGDSSVVETVTSSVDLWYTRLASKVSEQEKASGGKNGRRGTSDADHLDVSMIEGGSLLFLRVSSPVDTINPYVKIDRKTGSIIPYEPLKPLLEATRIKLDDK